MEAEDAGVYTCQVSAVESVEQVHQVEVTDVETKSNHTILKNIEITTAALQHIMMARLTQIMSFIQKQTTVQRIQQTQVQ